MALEKISEAQYKTKAILCMSSKLLLLFRVNDTNP